MEILFIASGAKRELLLVRSSLWLVVSWVSGLQDPALAGFAPIADQA